MNTIFRIPALVVLVIALSHCGLPQPPKCHRVPSASRIPAPSLIAEAQADWSVLANPSRRAEWNAASVRYNGAVAKLFDQLRCGADGWTGDAERMGTRIGSAGAHDVDPNRLDAVFPAALVELRKVSVRRTVEGIGVPLVGWKATAPLGQKRPPYTLPDGQPYVLTATLAFDGGTPVWHFTRRELVDEIHIGGSTHPLAADWTAPNEFYWHMGELDKMRIENVLLPDRFTEDTGFFFVTPYDPAKIPVVFVHGLVSSPDAFKNMINELVPEPWFRKHYQIWLYNYPTGNPWLYSSMVFRAKMRKALAYARAKGSPGNLGHMVIVCHSMGGLLTRSGVTAPGDAIYNEVFDQPIDQLEVPSDTRRLIQESLLYQPIPPPERMVFLAVPHRGSPMATWGPAVWVQRFIHLPKDITVNLLDSTLVAVSKVAQGQNPPKRLPNSISSLSPNSPGILGLDKMPLPKGMICHSVIGDRGKGDTPNSSDGVVPYWSSHVEPVASELIVPSDHSVPDNPEAAAEVKRILLLHLRQLKR